MSIKLMTAVFDRYPNGGGEMLLALALADHASDDGTKVYPSIKALAEKTRQSERTVQYQLRRMQETGWLILVGAGNGGRSMTSEYRISPIWIKGAEIAPFQKGATDDTKGASDNTKGCNLTHERVQPIAPANNRQEPSENHQVTVIDGASAKKPKANRSTVLPADFMPNETAEAMALEMGLNLGDQQAAFEDHHAAKGSTFIDWQAAFRTWLRNATRFGRSTQATGAPQRSGETGYQRSMRERAQEVVPSIARQAPEASPTDFFKNQAIEVAARRIEQPQKRIGGGA
ncbi:helix-turn-helix domain-containing protein [Comamonas sp. JUb58]|uniref:helix-turn-helix domain-containing protein n=1 Tax=Comamonas sp. JUb58 TaxID=2485114 RepID=UPI00105EFD5F|nr:helix-turn-helix domain-containing protein [Comamonas sp. JUb58]TDS82609.1 helix-turn-helix protein [Comamonas sp. JUb58]